ncbi:MAG: TetR/AcrR family transcriptional regulator [Caulobacterales bacterium]
MGALMPAHGACAGLAESRALEFPDPCDVLWPYENVAERDVGRRWMKQRRLRSNILATARTEMATGGFEAVQLRAIARSCQISVQTIYNLVGDRPQVVRLASEEWVTAMDKAARRRTEGTDVSHLLALLGVFWASPLHCTNYVTNAASVSRTRADPLNRIFRTSAIKIVHDALKHIAEKGDLREQIDTFSLARQLTSAIQIAVYDWTVDKFDIGLYWRDFENGPALMLLAAVKGEETARVQNGLQLIRKQSCYELPVRH